MIISGIVINAIAAGADSNKEQIRVSLTILFALPYFLKNIDDIMWDDSITMFESLNTLFLIYNIKNASSAHTKRVMLKQNTTRKKKFI